MRTRQTRRERAGPPRGAGAAPRRRSIQLTNTAMTGLVQAVQREEKKEEKRSKWHPTNFSSYGDWLQALPADAVDETAKDVTGEAAVELPDLAALVTDLKADCADVGIVLRHYWLKGNGKSGIIRGRDPKNNKKHKNWKIGAGVSKKRLRLVLIYIGTIHFQTGERSKRRQLNWYGGASPHLNLKMIIEAGLEPGDVLMWKKNPGVRGNFSGHFQTVQRINMPKLAKGMHGPPAPHSIDVLQGTMYRGVRAGELQSKRLTFLLLTGKEDGDGPITHQPGGEEHFVGAGSWR